MYSNTCIDPSGPPSGVVVANRVGGSHAVTDPSSVSPRTVSRVVPPSPATTSLFPMNQESSPAPVVIACQTSSGEASTSNSWVSSNGCGISGPLPVVALLRLQARVHGHDDAMVAPSRRVLVVVLAYQRCDRGGQLLGERRPVASRREPDLSVHRERRQTL